MTAERSHAAQDEDDETVRLFLGASLEDMDPLALFGERCAALLVLGDPTAGERLREYLRHRLAACDALLAADEDDATEVPVDETDAA